MLKAKIHQATVTEANLYYVGSITIDGEILAKLGLHEYEQVHVVNINNGSRIETYIIRGENGSGVFCLNGAAARFFHEGDKIIVMSYCQIENNQAQKHHPKIALMNENNQIASIVDHELANSYS
jgi:aspartate 1-decarboxylase